MTCQTAAEASYRQPTTLAPIRIVPGELIVGNQARRPRAAPLFPENSSAWIEKELDGLGSRPQDAFLVREEDKLPLREALP